MKRNIAAVWATALLVLFSSAALGQTVPAPTVKQSPVASPKRVQFIANSLVYYNGALQTHMHRIAAEPTVSAALFAYCQCRAAK